MNLYLRLWRDCLLRMKDNPKMSKEWKLNSFLLMSGLLTLNLFVALFSILFILKRAFNIRIILFYDYSFISFFAIFLLACIGSSVFNYFLIIRNDRYLNLMINKENNKNLLSIYFIFSMLSVLSLSILMRIV